MSVYTSNGELRVSHVAGPESPKKLPTTARIILEEKLDVYFDRAINIILGRFIKRYGKGKSRW
jgi:hypothetical protein